MNLKRIALILGIALIPAWYLYRTFSEHRITRLTWNEIFLTEDDRLRKEIADEREQAEKDISEARAEYSEGKRRQDAVNCFQLAKVVHADYDRYIQELNRWKSDLDSLSHSKTGLAIAQNEDYMRTFQELHPELAPESSVDARISEIESISKACGERRVAGFTGESDTQRLNSIQWQLEPRMEALIKARLNVEALGHLATGEPPKSFEEGARRQYLKELTEDLKATRERELRFKRL